MIANNIDITDARANTLVPFNRQEPYSVGSLQLTELCFLSIKIKCQADSLLPVYLRNASVDTEDTDLVTLVFSDLSATVVGKCYLKVDPQATSDVPLSAYKGALVFSDDRMLFPVGHVVYRPDVATTLYNAAIITKERSLNFGTELELLPECIGIRYPLNTLQVQVNGEDGDISAIAFGEGLRIDKDDDGVIRINAEDANIRVLTEDGDITDLPRRINGIGHVVVQQYYTDSMLEFHKKVTKDDLLIEPKGPSDVRIKIGSSLNIVGTVNA